MRHAAVEKFCLSLPGATLSVQWGEERIYKVGGKMFAMQGPKTRKPHTLFFKAGETSFYILTQLRHIIPAPYLARAHWVYLERLDALNTKELKAYLERAHAQVAMGLSKKKRAALGISKRPEF
ncbi:MAG: MmcQ/YjbR family DNA-binding protein [Alphaproteobacteria bacterium]|nr:MmcQ/YjbR family DNA-binding protein [Alphaproteobacteria bacterium]MDE2111047.1 MmcQ/YjbR family DNA-binding protein [Alphaproteobacteria bacterium]MDE2494747.1 MmcQ/YjbR family DNA-binding protein [Alphaproteobacteria bacterium]